jgi:hypothetical protein
MISVTGNYFTDLQAAIEAGIIVKKGAKNPPKAEVYAAIEAYNQQVQVVEVEETAKSEYDWVEVDRFDKPEGVWRCDAVPGFEQWMANAMKAYKHPKIEGEIHAGYVVYELQRVSSSNEVVKDDEPTCEELLALDAEEDAQLAAQPKKSRKQKSQQPSKLDLLVQAMQDGVTDIDQLAQASGMKPQGVKGWVGVIRNKGLDNWKQSCRKSA